MVVEHELGQRVVALREDPVGSFLVVDDEVLGPAQVAFPVRARFEQLAVLVR
jgi:hypothetical protein